MRNKLPTGTALTSDSNPSSTKDWKQDPDRLLPTLLSKIKYVLIIVIVVILYCAINFQIIFVFESALLPQNKELGDHLVQHGDGVKDVAFEVDDVVSVTEFAKKNGAKIVQDVTEESDEHGTIRYSSVQTVKIFFIFIFKKTFFSTETRFTP